MDDKKLVKCRHGKAMFPCEICEREDQVLKLLVKITELKAELKLVKECEKNSVEIADDAMAEVVELKKRNYHLENTRLKESNTIQADAIGDGEILEGMKAHCIGEVMDESNMVSWIAMKDIFKMMCESKAKQLRKNTAIEKKPI